MIKKIFFALFIVLFTTSSNSEVINKIIIEGNPKDLIQKYDQEDGNLENVFLSLTGKELRD